MAKTQAPITSPPPVPGQVYDATSPDGHTIGGTWAKVGNDGPVDGTGMTTGDGFADGPGPWRQC